MPLQSLTRPPAVSSAASNTHTHPQPATRPPANPLTRSFPAPCKKG
ncbi:MAG: hypothetical protein ACK5NB_14210 [Flavobacteriaceae bacterium]